MRAAWLSLLLLGGCFLDDGNPPPPCQTAGIADILQRDPSSGQCVSTGTPCDSQCGPCPALDIPALDWGSCSGPCEGLGEAQCLANASCHAAYSDDPTPSPVFSACWELPPSGPIQGGGCDGLDAQTCSEHTDCASLLTGPVNQPPNFVPSFERCIAEPGTNACSATDCGTGSTCVVTPEAPTTPLCETTTAAGACMGTVTCTQAAPACPAGTTPGIAGGCYTHYCIPNDECPLPACSTLTTESACLMRSDCDTVYVGTNCTCDNNGCTCQTKTFEKCQ